MIAPPGIFAILTVALTAIVSNALPPQKIVGGSSAVLGEFPYQVSLRTRNQHFCGGAIISKRHIITAAHCVVGAAAYSLTIATGTISSTGGQIHYVSKIESHPKYVASDISSPNDLAIITLAADITFNKNQNKLDLPSAATPVGVTAIATGWGFLNANVKMITPSLLKVELKTISNAECQQRLGDDLYQNQFCTYIAPGLGTCQGDSGGPLAYNGKLIGLVSFGIPCAVGFPDVYTSVYHHLSWINQKIDN